MRRVLVVAAVYLLAALLLCGVAGAQGNEATCTMTQTGPGTYNLTVTNMGTAANLIYSTAVTDPSGYITNTTVSAYGSNAPTTVVGGAGPGPGTYTTQVSVLMGHGKDNAAPWYNDFKYSAQGSCSVVLS